MASDASHASAFARDWAEFATGAADAFESLADRGAALARATSARATTSARELARQGSAIAVGFDQTRVVWFLALSGTSCFAYGLGFVVGAPTLPIAPAKFGLCFSLGTVCSVCAVGALRGAGGQLAHMTSEERLPASAALVATTLMTLHAAVWRHSYLMTVFWSILQAVAVVHYQVSYFPYGSQGLRATLSIALTMAQPVCGGCLRALGFASSAASSRTSVLPM